MKKNEVKKIVEIAEKLDWNVTEEKGEFELEKYSPAGQDFSINISADSIEEFAEKLNDRYNNFDCSEEAYIWLDESGHGKNGAPYDMKDVYEDMEACGQMLNELVEEIQNIDN
jgi:hypothetical protein